MPRRCVDAVVDNDTAEDLTVAVSEALINAVEHAFTARTAPGSLGLHATVADDLVLITITDDGTWRSANDAFGHHGRGLTFIHQLTTHAHIELTPEAQPCAYDTSSCHSAPLARARRALCENSGGWVTTARGGIPSRPPAKPATMS